MNLQQIKLINFYTKLLNKQKINNIIKIVKNKLKEKLLPLNIW
mgnify:CR=1 FL=1